VTANPYERRTQTRARIAEKLNSTPTFAPISVAGGEALVMCRHCFALVHIGWTRSHIEWHAELDLALEDQSQTTIHQIIASLGGDV
jgi:uncharacterized radical SAM superfamily protein